MGRFRRRQRVEHEVETPVEDGVWQVPAQFNFTRDVVEALAEDPFRSALAFVDRDGIIERRTFKHVVGDASRWTALLRSRGLVPGDRVGVLMADTPEWLEVLLGTLKAGLVAVPCPKTLLPQDVAFRIEDSGARLVVADLACAPLLERLDPAIERVVTEDVRFELRTYSAVEPTHDTASEDTALILYSTGPAGTPLGVVHTHASTWAARLQARHWLDARPNDLIWCTAPAGTTHSIWNVLLGPWSCSAEVALHDDDGLDIEQRFDLLERLGVTVLCQAPWEYRLMAEHGERERFRLGIVRHAVSGGAPLGPELVDMFQARFGLTLHDGYGQTENTIIVANSPGIDVRPGSMGLPTPGHDVAVINGEGAELRGTEGEIALRGNPPSLFRGYWNAPAETRAMFSGGWYLTGDRAVQDEDGYLWFSGRDVKVAPRAAQWIDAPPVERESRTNERRRDAVDLEPIDAPAAGVEGRERDREAQTREATVLAAEQARRDDALSRLAAEARAHDEEQQAKQDEKRRREEEKAAAEQARRDEAAARRAAEAKAREDEQQAKQNEKRRREEEKAAAEQARRDEATAQRAAEAKAREDEQQAKQNEKRRREEQKAAAEQARRDEATAQRAAEAKAREDAAEKERLQAVRRSGPEEEEGAEGPPSEELIARLRAYGHGDDIPRRRTPSE